MNKREASLILQLRYVTPRHIILEEKQTGARAKTDEYLQ